MVSIDLNLPDSFFKEETRLNYTISSKQKEIWAIELNMLVALDQVCKKLNIKYFLDSGTLLGAVRDGHFIPWDDDIDVIMLREDYNILLNEGAQYFSYPLMLQNAYTDYSYFRGHSQIRDCRTCGILPQELGNEKFNQGIFIDVFVMDGVDLKQLKLQNLKREKCYIIESFIKFPHSKNKIKNFIKRPFIVNYLRRKYGDLPGLYSYMENIYCHNNTTEYVDKLLFRTSYKKVKMLKRSWYKDSKKILFEGFEFPIPYNYDEVLKVYYGDNYLIPVKNYGNAHNKSGDVIFDTNRSYKEVLREKGYDI